MKNQNTYRNDHALGKTPNYEPAVRMATLQWDPELAELADLNVRTCVYRHDQCRNTSKKIKTFPLLMLLQKYHPNHH